MDFLIDMFAGEGGDAGWLFAVLVFVACASIAFGFMAVVRSREGIRRRTADIASLDQANGDNSLANTSKQAVQRLVEHTTKHYASMDGEAMKVLRRRMVQAGIFDPRAVGFFFLLRAVLAVVLGLVVALAVP